MDVGAAFPSDRAKGRVGNVRRLRTALWILGGLALLALLGVCFVSGKVRVTVHNMSSTPLREVRVQISRKSISIVDLGSRASASCTAVPGPASDIVVSYREADGTSRSAVVDVYLERGSTGTVDVWIDGADVDGAGHSRWEEKIWWTVPWQLMPKATPR
jgi:hypothetical protein